MFIITKKVHRGRLAVSAILLVLTIAVLAIVITAPLGAFAIDLLYKKLLIKQEN